MLMTTIIRIDLRLSCNPLAGIEVFHTGKSFASAVHLLHHGCNPLAGIEVFHTIQILHEKKSLEFGAVVIPWRGLRCFTRQSPDPW